MSIKLGKQFKINKDGKVVRQVIPRDASHAIAMKTSKKQRVVRKVVR